MVINQVNLKSIYTQNLFAYTFVMCKLKGYLLTYLLTYYWPHGKVPDFRSWDRGFKFQSRLHV